TLLRLAFGQNCGMAGTPAWSEQLRNVIADCETRLPSPDGKLDLILDTRGQAEVSRAGSKETTKANGKAVQPPAMASWSPNSNAFFVNDGEGSGISSVFRLFRIQAKDIVEDGIPHKRAVSLYRKLKKCGSKGNNPEVWGIGWSSGGTHVYVFIQATAHDPC